jgi:polar amino acid transport system substrate-binding protein
MRKNIKFIVTVMLIFSIILTIAGCGKTQEAVQNDQSKEVVYKVGTEPTFPPFESLDPKTNKITGFDIELIQAIAKENGIKVEVQSIGFDGLIPALQSGTINIIASGMTIRDDRKKQIDFTDPYINAGLALAVAKSNDSIKSLDDLKGKSVAVQIGTTGAIKADELKKSGVVKEIRTYNTVDVVMAELAKGTVDAVINDAPVTQDFIVKGHDEIKIVGDLVNTEQYGFAVAKNNPELLQKLNDGLKKVIENGKYAQLLKKYNLPENAQPK